ncbi:hypothetical protein D3C81_2111500 [compost metagenome]
MSTNKKGAGRDAVEMQRYNVATHIEGVEAGRGGSRSGPGCDLALYRSDQFRASMDLRRRAAVLRRSWPAQ